MKLSLPPVLLFLLLLPALATAKEVGEFSIPAVSPLNGKQLKKMRQLVRDDPEAAALAEAAKAAALPLLDKEPQPLKVIHYEGLVNTDPRRIATVEKLSDMTDVARLLRYWQVSGDERAAEALERYILAWTRTYQITGNDVNENKFHPLLSAYYSLRGKFPESDRGAVDDWVQQLGKIHAEAVQESDHLTNRFSKHVRLAAVCGMILDRPAWIELAFKGIRRFVKNSLYPDGSSQDLKRRDSLTYHISALRPPMELGMLLGEKGRDVYSWEAPQGASIKKSVEFVVPYALGEKEHREWVNSKVGLDKRRAKAGLEKYRPGRLFEPRKALSLMEKAAYFDADLMKVVHHLIDSQAERFPTWQTLVNEAARS